MAEARTHRTGRLPDLDVALVVAAVDRAGDDFPYSRPRNEPFDGPTGSATVAHIRSHLGGGHRARRNGDDWDQWQEPPFDGQVRRALKAAQAAGWVVKLPPPGAGAQLWLVTPDGDAMLAELERIDLAPELPESPRHRAWRVQRDEARAGLPRLRDEIRAAAARLHTLADATNADGIDWLDTLYDAPLWEFQDALEAAEREEPPDREETR